ncbi:hypothetical protein [Fulvimarina sp. MAC3]|uniref:hypothetical protein n=1 Tax=Fulvimarina sp. MAC3 TaxID=3148887 RepID=UPI0031FD54B9
MQSAAQKVPLDSRGVLAFRSCRKKGLPERLQKISGLWRTGAELAVDRRSRRPLRRLGRCFRLDALRLKTFRPPDRTSPYLDPHKTPNDNLLTLDPRQERPVDFDAITPPASFADQPTPKAVDLDVSEHILRSVRGGSGCLNSFTGSDEWIVCGF